MRDVFSTGRCTSVFPYHVCGRYEVQQRIKGSTVLDGCAENLSGVVVNISIVIAFGWQ